MKLLLLKSVPKVGNSGTVVNVADGYARNYLLPKKLAVPATDTAVEKIQHDQKRKIKDLNQRINVANKIGNALQAKQYKIKKEASDQGTLFAAISSSEIAELVSSKKYKVSADQIILPAPIKQLGQYKVSIKLENSNVIPLTINVEKK